MKQLAFLSLLVFGLSFGQNTLVKKDGTKFVISDVEVFQPSHKIAFKANGMEQKIAFADLDSAVIGNKILKRFDIGKKARVYYVLTSTNGKTLAVTSSKRARDRGGFQSVVTLYEVIVYEKGKLLQEIKFTESKTQDEVKKRKEFYRIANDAFSTCDVFLKRLMLFDTESDDNYLILLHFLDNPEYVKCK